MQPGTQEPPMSYLSDPVSQLAQLGDLVYQIETECGQVNLASRGAVLAQHRPALLSAMHMLGGAINDFLAHAPAQAEIADVKKQVATQVRAWSATGPFFHHAFNKPRGYPGDFETIEIIYDCQPRGEDLPG